MAFQIVGQPGHSAFLVSLLQGLDATINMGDDLYMEYSSELKRIVKILRRIGDVLVDAERRRLLEKSVDMWMDELKDLFYDIDDLVDDLKMVKQQLQQAKTGQPSNSSTQVSCGFPNVYNTKTIINSSLSEFSKRVDNLAQEAVRLELKRDLGQYNANWVASQAMVRPKTGSCADESEMHGRDKDKDNIIDLLLLEDGGKNKKNYEVVCIVGMGGLGKTTLAQLVFEDRRVKNYFTVKSWACVSDVFNVIQVTKDLIESAEEGNGTSNMPSSLPALQVRLKKIINGKKIFLVLDDVWTAAKEWEKLKSPLNCCAKGSKILVTTRQLKMAKAIGNKAPYKLGRLADAHCQAIFNDNAFGEIDGSDDLMKLGEEIVSKCGGVPLVAKLIGAMLRGEDEAKWKAVKENDLWNLAYEDEDLHPGIRLSYFDLPSFLKRCFEYFALFPSDSMFEKDEIVRMWMAEGLIEVKEGTEPEEIGGQYYDDLKGRSIIQENDMMHDMVRHLACIVSGRFFYPGNSGSGSSTSSLGSVRHGYNRKKSELLIGADKLRTLIYKGALCREVFSCERLRVLDLNFVHPHTFPQDLCKLSNLRFLRLCNTFTDGCLIYGREKDLENVIDMLLVEDGGRSRKNYEVVCIVGMEGLGKTALAQLVFQDERVRNHFTVKSWVSASVADVFDVFEVTKDLIEYVEEDRYHTSSLQALQDRLMNIINGKKIFLVLDDIWTAAKEWENLIAPLDCCAKGSKILVTTRQVEEAKAISNKAPYELGRLKDAYCQTIFNEHAFGEIDGSDEDADLMKLGEEIVSKCGGVPLLAKLSGSSLRGKAQGEWKVLYESDVWNSGSSTSFLGGLPDSICTLTNLQVLDLSYYTDLRYLPQDIGKLSNLRFLRLKLTGITRLPESVCNLVNLQVLDISGNESRIKLPNEIGNLKRLKILRRP